MLTLTVFTQTHKLYSFSDSETENYAPYDYGESPKLLQILNL